MDKSFIPHFTGYAIHAGIKINLCYQKGLIVIWKNVHVISHSIVKMNVN